MKTYGYARVSTADQSTEMQIEELTKSGCDEVVRDDAFSGSNAARPGLQKVLLALRSGDTLVVWKLDRLGRSLGDLIGILDGLKAKGVEFRSLREAIDTRTAIGRLMWQIIGAFAEFERECIKERVQAGQARARQQGVKFGQPNMLSAAQLSEVQRMKAEGKSHAQVCAVFNIGRTTLVQNLKRLREMKSLGEDSTK